MKELDVVKLNKEFKGLNLDSRITTLAFRNPAITIATCGEQAMA